MPVTFELETRDGMRKVEFDPDVFWCRDVRILVDGERAALLPYPKPATPYHEVSFELGGQVLVGIAQLSTAPEPVEPGGLRCDLFAGGRSLTDGSSLAEARERAPAPGEAYPGAFRVIDMTLRIVPAASAPGIAIALTRRGSELGWSTVLGLLATIVGAVALATVLATRVWARVRGVETRSVSARAALGWAVVIGCYLVAAAGVLAIAVLIGQGGGGVSLKAWLATAMGGAFAALVAWYGLYCLWPQFRSLGARRMLLVLLAAVIAGPTIVVAISAVVDVPRIAFSLSVLPVLVATFVASWLVRITGASTPRAVGLTDLLERLQHANQFFEVGDIDAWRRDLRALDAVRTPSTERYIDLWQQYGSEEAARRAGSRQSSRETLDAIRTAATQMSAQAYGVRPRLRNTLVALAMVGAVLPNSAVIAAAPQISPDACIRVNAYLGQAIPATGTQSANPQTLANLLLADPQALANLLLADPGTPAILVDDGILNLDTLAASRHDPASRELLLRDRYMDGHARAWRTAEGRTIEVEVLQFADASGAAAFDRSMADHACGYSNEAFGAPGGGVGLQIRYGSGDAIHEQIAWVVGARRMLVSRTFLAPPADHRDILDLAARARARLEATSG